MRLFCLILFANFISILSNSQHLVKGEMFMGKSIYLYSKIDTAECSYVANSSIESFDKFYYILSDSICNNVPRWYILLHDNKMVFAERHLFKEINKIDSILKIIKKKTPNIWERMRLGPDEISQLEKENQKRIEEEEKKVEIETKLLEEKQKKEIDSLVKILEKTYSKLRTNNLFLYEWSWSYPNEYSSFTDISVTVLNPFKQKVKYLWFTFRAFNPVGDIVKDGLTGKADKTVQGIGPIEYGDQGSYTFESVFYSKVIESMKVTQIKIQFFDGSVKTITNPIQIKKEEEE